MLCAVLLALSTAVPTPGPSQQPPQVPNGRPNPSTTQRAGRPSNHEQGQADKSKSDTEARSGGQQDSADSASESHQPKSEDCEPEDERSSNWAHSQAWAAWAMVVVTFCTGGVVLFYAIQAKKQADAMKTSVALAERQLDAMDRPWITVTPKPGGPLSSGEDQVYFWAELMLKNVGRSPAINVNCRAVLVPCPPKLDPTLYTMRAIEQQGMMEAELTNEYVASAPRGLLLVPGDPLEGWVVPESQEKQLVSVAPEKLPSTFELLLVGCVAYRSTASERICWTRFAYHVGAASPGPNARHAMLLPSTNDVIMREKVCFFPTWGANSAT